jgi:CYTH domain-containing protein
MGMEIERKYLVRADDWRTMGTPVHYAQGYLVADNVRTVRLRIAGSNGFLTIKGSSRGMSRLEFEYPIPVGDAMEMLKLCPLPVIEKFRSRILFEGKIWEVDEFEGENKGLILAEIELTSEEETFAVPDWIGEEVTGDVRYFNSRLAIHPFSKW